jgi:hypothetical protein
MVGIYRFFNVLDVVGLIYGITRVDDAELRLANLLQTKNAPYGRIMNVATSKPITSNEALYPVRRLTSKDTLDADFPGLCFTINDIQPDWLNKDFQNEDSIYIYECPLPVHKKGVRLVYKPISILGVGKTTEFISLNKLVKAYQATAKHPMYMLLQVTCTITGILRSKKYSVTLRLSYTNDMLKIREFKETNVDVIDVNAIDTRLMGFAEPKNIQLTTSRPSPERQDDDIKTPQQSKPAQVQNTSCALENVNVNKTCFANGKQGTCVHVFSGDPYNSGHAECEVAHSAGKRKSSTYAKTTRTYTTKKGQKRVVYTKNNKFYIKRKSPTTGKFRYALIKLTS